MVSNQYGAIDVDGDGVIDDTEMALATRLKSMTLSDKKATHVQHEGRKMMVRDFINGFPGEMWKLIPTL